MDSFRFGLNATNQYTTWDEYRNLALTAEQLDLDSFWVFDHFVPGPFSPDGAALECLTTLSALAAITERITLGSLVLGVTYRNPALVAKMAAMIDVFSNGRFVLGMGAGWYALEHAMYGIPFPGRGERVDRVDEALTVIRKMWTEQPASFAGRYYQVDGALVDPPPVQRPSPPILIGARGPRMLELVAKHADMYNSAADVATIIDQKAAIDGACLRAGRDPATVEHTAIVLHSFATTPEAERAKQERLCELFRQPWENLQNRVLSGSPDQVTDQLGRYLEAGVSHFMLSTMAPYDLDALDLLTSRILPQLRR